MTGSVLLFGLLGLFAGQAVAQSTSDVIQDDTYFYGLSPPAYPSPNISSTGPWADAYSQAKALVEQMTLEEKVLYIIPPLPPNIGPLGHTENVRGMLL